MCVCVRFHVSFHRDVNLEIYTTMIRLAFLDAFLLRHKFEVAEHICEL